MNPNHLNPMSIRAKKRLSQYVLLAVTAVIVASVGASFWAFSYAMRAETNVRYVGLQNMLSLEMSKTIEGMETNAKNVFDEVGKTWTLRNR